MCWSVNWAFVTESWTEIVSCWSILFLPRISFRVFSFLFPRSFSGFRLRLHYDGNALIRSLRSNTLNVYSSAAATSTAAQVVQVLPSAAQTLWTTLQECIKGPILEQEETFDALNDQPVFGDFPASMKAPTKRTSSARLERAVPKQFAEVSALAENPSYSVFPKEAVPSNWARQNNDIIDIYRCIYRHCQCPSQCCLSNGSEAGLQKSLAELHIADASEVLTIDDPAFIISMKRSSKHEGEQCLLKKVKMEKYFATIAKAGSKNQTVKKRGSLQWNWTCFHDRGPWKTYSMRKEEPKSVRFVKSFRWVWYLRLHKSLPRGKEQKPLRLRSSLLSIVTGAKARTLQVRPAVSWYQWTKNVRKPLSTALIISQRNWPDTHMMLPPKGRIWGRGLTVS